MKKSFVSLSLLLLLGAAIPALAQVPNGCVSDFIIVGNGTAGATLAGLLSDPVGSVLVLERGPNYATNPSITSAFFPTVFSLGDDTQFSIITNALTGQVNTGLLGLPYSIGRMWGGSSAHNFLFAFRGTANIWDEWAADSGDASWTYANLLPIMKFIEHYTSDNPPIDTTQRGTSGPLFITQFPYNTGTNPVPTLLFAIALSNAVDEPIIPDYNVSTAGDVGVSALQIYATPVAGAHPYDPSTSQRSFSVPAFEPQTAVNYSTGRGVGRPLNIVSLTTVTRVLFDASKNAIGVEYILNGNPEQVFRAFARKKVILAAGAIFTPAILQRSGIGDAAGLLNPLGIPVIVDNPAVGANLQTHYGPMMAFLNTGTATVQLPTGLSIVGVHDVVASSTMRTIQDIIGAGPNFAEGLFPQPQLLIEFGFSATTNIIALTPQLVFNGSRGTVAIVDLDPTFQPKVDLNLYGDGTFDTAGTDANNAVTVMRLLATGLTLNGFPPIFPSVADFADVTNARLFDAAKNVFVVQYHGAGTARMGTSIAGGAVVDNNLNVFGVNNLIVADLSIAPRLINGNTAWMGYVIAAKLAKVLGATEVP